MKMKNLLKTTFGIIVAMTAMLGVATTNVEARGEYDYKVGDEVMLGYTEYKGYDKLYCMQHGQKLRSKRTKYKVISQVSIDGTKSTDHTGKTIDNKSNAVFAYILNQSNGTGKKSDGYVANAIWTYGYTWMQNVGQHHAGLDLSFVRNKPGKYVDLSSAERYANEISAGQSAKDNTDKSRIKVSSYNKDGKQYMRVGPFNWTFSGTLSDISIYDQNGNSISEKLYSNFNGTTENWFNASGVKSGSDFYISIPASANVTKITKVTGRSLVNTKKVDVWFFKSETSGFQNLILIRPGTSQQNIDLSFDYDISILGNLKVIKVNKDNTTVKLQGVGFYLQNKETGKYVGKSADGKITYVDSKEQATEFITDKNGEFTVENLIVGTYVAYETKNPNYGYEIIKDGVEKTLTVDKTTELQIPNKQIYIKLSGYVWVDKISGKQSLRNDLYKDTSDSNYDDSKDILLDGIKVRLKDTSGNTIKEAVTANGGSYQFTDVLIENLDKYYVEFEYDGLTYTNVVSNIGKDNGSKAIENEKDRIAFNESFAKIEGKTEDTGIAKNDNDVVTRELKYNIDKNAHTSTLINNGQYTITANTTDARYFIKDHFIAGQEEIKYINLGLYEREQPDLALVKDLDNVNVAINGYNHIYKYASRFKNSENGENVDGFNVGVKFASKYVETSYSRAIYEADYNYINEKDKSKELQVYVTYRIAVKNASSNLDAIVNSVAEYYDKKFTLVSAGTECNNGKISGNVEFEDAIDTVKTNSGEYTKAIIKPGMKIAKQQTGSIYVQFKLDREAVLNILNSKDKENLDNVAEINSYSIKDQNGKTYAGIDRNSNPGNATPGDRQTYQDDTDSSPLLRLEVANARNITGTVFLDETRKELIVGETRLGNGTFDEDKGEKGIEGVEVTLKEVSENGQGREYKTKTDSNGNYTISGFIPGKYVITFTWGDKIYTVQNYKGTIYDQKRLNDGLEWYKKDVETRKNDAIDNYETREAIDDEIKTQKYDTKTTIDKMDSTTPQMEMGVEYDSTKTDALGDEFVYVIKNVDFGIVERARQDIAMNKSVAEFKATLANGQIIADVKIDENGKLEGTTNNITYMKPGENVLPKNGSIKLELDNELIQGTTIEVTYRITAKNNSEKDYLNENYYKYGIIPKDNNDIITITPSAVIDYLDKDWAYDESKNSGWIVKNKEDLKDLVAEQVYTVGENSENTINEKTILYTENLKKALNPEDTNSIDLKVSKILSNSGDIELDNETEIVKTEKPGGPKTPSTPGNYIPGTGKTETDDSTGETVIVTPNTGKNLNVILPIGIGIMALVVLGAGVVIIKKKAL